MTHSTFYWRSCDSTLLAESVHRAMRFLSSEDGVTAIEYALIASLIAVVALAGIAALGVQLGVTWTHIATEVGKVT